MWLRVGSLLKPHRELEAIEREMNIIPALIGIIVTRSTLRMYIQSRHHFHPKFTRNLHHRVDTPKDTRLCFSTYVERRTLRELVDDVSGPRQPTRDNNRALQPTLPLWSRDQRYMRLPPGLDCPLIDCAHTHIGRDLPQPIGRTHKIGLTMSIFVADNQGFATERNELVNQKLRRWLPLRLRTRRRR